MTILTPVPASVHLPTIPSPTKLLHYIFDSVGRTITLEEKFFDVCTALSGSGPAFACMFLESLADGAVMCGLPRREALEMAAQMMQGSARMILETGTHPAQLRDQVTTPGGCTIAGLLCLEDGKVRSTIARTVEVAAKQCVPSSSFPSGCAARCRRCCL
jgi:pyrroline-5-carboxylate reductase